jgi:aminocarboxymuconate-semialdehyde decarboxylase
VTRTIDIQGHYMPDAHWRALAAEADRHPAFARVAGPVLSMDASAKARRLDDARVAEMDAARLDVMAISLLPPALGFGAKEQASSMAHDANEGLLEAAARYPGRFVVIASLPLPHVDESLAELERIAAAPLVRGIQVIAQTTDWTPEEARFEPLYRRVAELGLLAVLHPSLEPLPAVYYGWGLDSSVATMMSTTLIALRLILSGMLDRVPGLEIVIPHLGGTIPYLTQRVASLSGRGDAEHDVIDYLRERIYYDSCSYQPQALRCAIDTVGGERIMLGSDYPFRGDLGTCVREIEAAPIPGGMRAAILGETAARWFEPAVPPVGVK